jgi:hypothetical protein
LVKRVRKRIEKEWKKEWKQEWKKNEKENGKENVQVKVKQVQIYRMDICARSMKANFIIKTSKHIIKFTV